MKIVIAVLVILFAVTACTWFINPQEETEPIGEVDSIITISGTVSETIDDCIFDGMCAFVIATEAHGNVTIIWSEGDSPNCANDMFGDLANHTVQIGDIVEAMGRVVSADAITTCGNDTFFIRKP